MRAHHEIPRHSDLGGSQTPTLKGELWQFTIKFTVSKIVIYFFVQNIVHCDLKPENVLLSSDSDFPQVRIMSGNGRLRKISFFPEKTGAPFRLIFS